MTKITKNTKLSIGEMLKAIHVEDDAPFELGKLYMITDVLNDASIDKITITLDDEVAFKYFIEEIGNYFELFTLENVEYLNEKTWLLKEVMENIKESEYKPLGLDIIEMENFIFQKAVEKIEGKTSDTFSLYNNKHLDKNEFLMIFKNINLDEIDKCSCCGTILMPENELYEDSLNEGASLCDECSVMNEETDMYENIYKKFDETKVVKDDILHSIFSGFPEDIPTYSEFINAGKFLPNWQLSEEYEYYDYQSVKNKIDELCEDFFTTLSCLEAQREQNIKQKKYNQRKKAEYCVEIEVLCELQQLHNIYANTDLSKLNEIVLTQDSRTTEDYSSIEILLCDEIKYDKLSLYLKSNLNPEFFNEVDKLIEAIKEAKSDKYETLCLYNC